MESDICFLFSLKDFPSFIGLSYIFWYLIGIVSNPLLLSALSMISSWIKIDVWNISRAEAKVLNYYNSVAIKTCEGEMIDVILPFYEEFYGNENLEESVMEIYKLKTAWYSVVGPYCMGALLGGLEEENLEKLEETLINLGIAFQIKDDLLGIYGDEKHIGKSTTSDVSEFKQTILYSHIINTEYKDVTRKDAITRRKLFKITNSEFENSYFVSKDQLISDYPYTEKIENYIRSLEINKDIVDKFNKKDDNIKLS